MMFMMVFINNPYFMLISLCMNLNCVDLDFGHRLDLVIFSFIIIGLYHYFISIDNILQYIIRV
jgi:hypothetical protein